MPSNYDHVQDGLPWQGENVQQRDQPGETSGRAAFYSHQSRDTLDKGEDMEQLFAQIKKSRSAKLKKVCLTEVHTCL
jgi:hypothetical protein